eukprot:g12463.t1
MLLNSRNQAEARLSTAKDHKCKDYFGRWHSVKDLRDRRNAAILKGMRWMHKFLTADRHLALIEIGDDAACIFFEIWSSSILRGAARGIAQDPAVGVWCNCHFCHGQICKRLRGRELFIELMYLIRCKDEMGLDASAMLKRADELWQREGLHDTDKLFGMEIKGFHKIPDSDWVVNIMNIMIMEFNQLLFPRRWPIKWGLKEIGCKDQYRAKETFEFIRGHRFFGPPYDREFRFHDSFYFVPWLYNYNRRGCLYWVKMARYRESTVPDLLLDIDGLSEAMDVLRGCGMTERGRVMRRMDMDPGHIGSWTSFTVVLMESLWQLLENPTSMSVCIRHGKLNCRRLQMMRSRLKAKLQSQMVSARIPGLCQL